jgi:hypothetical protein
VVECHLAKVKVASSNLVTRSNLSLISKLLAVIAQSAERILGKDKVTGSIPVNGSTRMWRNGRRARLRGVWVTPYGFKSHHPHQLNKLCGEVLKWLKRTVC